MSPEEAVALAADVADEGMRRGELPIGAVVLDGDAVIGRAHTGEKGLGRRIVHADLLAMIEADEFLGKGRSAGPLTLAVNLEPCIMCLGAAITLGVRRVWYGLESPDDGGAELLSRWSPPVEQPFFRRPDEVTGGFHRERARSQFAAYAALDCAPRGMRDWAVGLARP